MAHVKSGGRTRQGTPRVGRRLGIKLFGGESAKVGDIIVRQIGSSFHNGEGTKLGKDYTIYAVKEGKVSFKIRKGRRFVEVI